MFSTFGNVANAQVRQCSDGIDNDGDGLINEADPGCHTDGNAANVASYLATDNDEVDCAYQDQSNVNAQYIQNGYVVQAGWGVNQNKGAIYYAQVRTGFGNLSGVPWIDLPSASLPITCTGWIYVNNVEVNTLSNNQKLQFRVVMKYPGKKVISPISKFTYQVGMKEGSGTLVQDLPVGLELG